VSQQDEFGWLFQTLTRNPEPFPWQRVLFERFREGKIERALDIPTGLGKTAVMAVWLAARAKGAKIPRRLVYIVDRRAVVDQATDVAETLREAVDKNSDLKTDLGLDLRSLPISTLLGQHVDNRMWLEDPSLPAIILDPGSGNGLPRDRRFCCSPQASQGEGRQGGLPWQARRRRW
jgi:CRISPR-associated endonuclease/helicase Cas3